MILLVEDDAILRRDMEEILTQNGYLVQCVGNFKEVEEILLPQNPGIRVSDVFGRWKWE